jgi:Zn-dependent protease
MAGSSYKVATIAGIPIRIHVSLLLAVLVLMFQFGFWNGLLIEIGLVISIVLHELGHSLVAIRKGCRVREISLLCIGGAAQMERIPTRPLDEFLMALAGPLVSLVLGVGGIRIGGRLAFLPYVRPTPVNVIELLGWINIGLMFFNLLPSFPMDGGRILRAILTPRLGRLRATFIAARLGKIMAILFGIRGFFTQNWILVFIAFFIFIAAGNEYRMVQVQEAMKQQGFGDPFAGPEDDKVLISPPPYREGPASRADLSSDDMDDRWPWP